MAKKNKSSKTTVGDAGNIKKTYPLSVQERQTIQNLQSVMGILKILRDGLNYSITLEVAKVRDRLKIKESDAPEGFQRVVDMDPERYEMLVYDIKIKEKEEEPVDPEETLKN